MSRQLSNRIRNATAKHNNSLINAKTYYDQLDYRLDVKKRLIYIEQDIDSYTPGNFLIKASIIQQLSNDKKSPLTAVITNFGGDAHGMLGVVDAIRSYPLKINTLGLGNVDSAAVYILAAGTGRRYLSPNSWVMIHTLSSWVAGKTDDIDIEAQQLKRLQNQCHELLASFSKKSMIFWKDMTRTDFHISANDALRYGLIDEIKGPC